MDESEDNLSSEDMKSSDSPLTVKSKPKKRSLIERELETSLTSRITSPMTSADGTSTSRYGRARRLKADLDQPDTKKVSSELKSPLSDQTPIKTQPQSPVYKMHASNSPVRRKKAAKKPIEQFVDNQIESIYQENISLSRFSTEEINTATPSPTKKFPKVYIRKDLIQKREPEETVLVIQNIFSPGKSGKKSSNTHVNNILERSSERYTLSSKPNNGYLDNSSVVKTLDFDGSKKKKKESKDVKSIPSKSELFELEAKCEYQVGDLAWARMGTYPFWPSIVTREPSTGLFVKKKLCGRVEHDFIHVIFFGDNGRHAWVMDNMLMKYLGQLEFETAREKFTPEAKKKDRSLYAAYFVSEKKQHLWNASVEEAEMLLREPKRLRIDLFNDILVKARSTKVKQPKSKISRTDSDVSLSESLYDSLFSEDDGKIDNNDKSKSRSRNKSLDMFEVVTACLDNMAAKAGITKIQRQSHMDRWLQKAKSKTPEKTKAVTPVKNIEKVEEKKQIKLNSAKKKKHISSKTPVQQSYSLRKSNSRNHLSQNEHDYTKIQGNCIVIDSDHNSDKADTCPKAPEKSSGIGFIIKVESLADKSKESKNREIIDDTSVSMDSIKNKSIDMNGTCESETYTDSNSSTNNNVINQDKNESQDRNEFLNNESVDLEENPEINSDAAKNMGPLSNNIDSVVENIKPFLDKPDSGVESPKIGASGDIENIDLKVKHTEKQGDVKFDDATKINEASDNEIKTRDSRDPKKPISLELKEDTIALNSEDNIKCHETSEIEEPITSSELGKDSLNSDMILDDKDNEIEGPISHSELEPENDSVQSHDSSLHNKETSTEYTTTTSNPGSNTVSQSTGVDESSIETDTNTSQNIETAMQDSEFINYLELRQDALIDENPDLTQNEIVAYLYKTWLYEANKSDLSLDTSSNIYGVKKLRSSTPERKENDTKSASEVHSQEINAQEHGIEVSSAQDIREQETSAPETNTQEICTQEVNAQVTEQENNREKEVLQMYEEGMTMDDDSDSESERLPYSPLSNLGNNSDDDLADVPLKDDKTREVENQKLSAAIEENRYETNDIDNRPKKNEVYNDAINNFVVGKHEQTKIINSQDIQNYVDENIMTNKLVQNGHVSDDNETHNKENNIHKEHKKHEMSDCINNVQISDLKTVPSNGYRGENVREVEMSAKELRIYVTKCPDMIQQNGVHNMNGDCDIEAASIHSEDSLTSTKSETRRKLRSKQDKKLDDPMENPEFLKYMELRQDSLMDENPELNEKEIVAYLHKTWLYEESVKSDVKKSEDLKELNLVKGLNQPQVESPTRNKRKLSLARNKSTKSSNTLQRFWRRKNEVEHKNDIKDTDDEEEIFPCRRRGAKKNIILDDDDDGDLDTGDEELLKSPRSSKKNSDLPKAETSEEKINKCDLPEGDVVERPLKHPIEENTAQLVNGDITQHNLEIFNENQVRKDKDNSECTETSVKETTKLLIGTSKSDVSKFAKRDDVICTKIDDKEDLQNKLSSEISSPIGGTLAPVMVAAITKLKDDGDADSIDSEDSEAPLIKCKLRSKGKNENETKKEKSADKKIKEEELDTISINSEDSEVSITKRKKRLGNKTPELAYEDPEFIKYLELRRDALIDENPQLSQNEIVAYLYKTWIYEENMKSDIRKTDDIEQSTLVKGLNDSIQTQPKKVKRKITKTEKAEKDTGDDDFLVKEKPKRKSVKPFYNEEYSDIEEELEVFEIFKPKIKAAPKAEPGHSVTIPESEHVEQVVEVYDEVELYFAELTKPKPNVFKGLVREKVCEICENLDNLVKCKGCNGMFHVDCVKRQMEVVEVQVPTRGRKKRKGRPSGRKPKNSGEFDSDDRSQDVSEDNNASIEEIVEADPHTVDAETLEAQLTAKMKEILDSAEKIDYESYSSDDGLDWHETVPGKCEIVDVKLKPRRSIYEIDHADFKCNNCQTYNTPICFVCKGAVSKKDSTKRQKCHVAHCQKYYHLECLEQWPQTQFNGGEPSKNNKKISEYFEALTCPRHVCHTCVSDDPRGCKTRFSGDKLARCVRCPATYHSFTKCLPAGTQILTASHIICPRHYEHRPGKVPCHVNTGWCFICALGGSLICCEYCPTSFHAECLNIDPPEGGYMCEDCETGRLPLYGEMVWVKLGHYRWWPGIILHPYEIPENLMAIKHSHGEFVVRFFGQYDHYWVNRGRVFPFQEGDSGRISSQKSKIDAAFTTAMEHAQRACEILKTAQPNQEESLDIASSLLPPHYVKLKVNKPCGSLIGKKLEDPENSLTQCECNPNDDDPCGPYSQCLNRMLLTECGPMCRAGDRCNNRAFEKRLYPKLTPYRTPSRGWGLKTLEDIKAGQFVIEYVGELIDEEETRRRMRRKHEMRDENFYFLTLDKERMIDAGPKGNLARFMNHCCEPNCETQKWTVLGDVRVGLFALYDIPAHGEVTFNYNLECAGIDKKRCMCGAKRCSGYIGAKPKQDESQTKKNKPQPTKRTYKKRKPEESPSTKSKQKRPIGRPPKPKELTEIEKDLLIIQSATNGVFSDDSSRISSEFEKNPKALKRKRVSFPAEEAVCDTEPCVKKSKLDNIEGD